MDSRSIVVQPGFGQDSAETADQGLTWMNGWGQLTKRGNVEDKGWCFLLLLCYVSSIQSIVQYS